MSLERPEAPNPYDYLPEVPRFTVESPSFTDGANLPEDHVFNSWGLHGGNSSPALTWSGAPEGTKGYAVTCFDPDAPTPSGFWHWIVVGIPADVTSLPAGAGTPGDADLPQGAYHLSSDFGTRGYGGCAPPAGDIAHRYQFVVHALDTDDMGLPETTPAGQAAFNMTMHTLGRAIITGFYQVKA
ncbi:YbhB/YbcL family Raf kinase inhibitor-like protein [Kribbia dieselivorans]|uniref:YbhB/YbcL family Raf kinase inhibitor-like protein n=1 Tax=Kribbia dieselivorans TaxID=331526 RepID=UPI000838BF53|nr:YbhB/YbcL family Raf kinase inhibitor-like protein [Kribbia dieselivorans]